MDDELLATEIGDEDFFEQAGDWKPDAKASAREQLKQSIAKVDRNRRKPASLRKRT
jgi:hypothetical protein